MAAWLERNRYSDDKYNCMSIHFYQRASSLRWGMGKSPSWSRKAGEVSSSPSATSWEAQSAHGTYVRGVRAGVRAPARLLDEDGVGAEA